MGIDAFVDRGFSDKDFLRYFLSSPEFNVNTLRKLHPLQNSKSKTKDILVNEIISTLENSVLSERDILLAYLEEPKTWLSFMIGSHLEKPNLDDPVFILKNFGEEKWYGPIPTNYGENSKKWYLRIHKVPNPVFIGVGESRKLDKSQNIRWIVSAEVCSNHVSLHWKGFSHSIENNDEIPKQSQFPYWQYIPNFFDELKDLLKGEWEDSNLYELVLSNLWNKYLNKKVGGFQYQWQHLHIRAEASGVALNARSAGSYDIDVRGLQALSKQLAKSAIESLGLNTSEDSYEFVKVEDALLKTILREWGTKSYEFRLEKLNILSENEISEDKPREELVFKAHCYFGSKPSSVSPDSFIHLRCFKEFGGSFTTLSFLINELDIGGRREK